MLTYKITFVKNQIDSCKIASNPEAMTGSLIFQVYKGFLIYVLVKAESEEQAVEKANELAKRLLKTGNPD